MTAPPFLQFWKAVNAALTRSGYPEVNHGAARHLWESTLIDARREAVTEMRRLDRAAASGT